MLNNAHRICPGHRVLLMAVFSLAVVSAAFLFARAAEAQEAGDSIVEARTPLTPAELEALVGPIALYPDNLVSIVLPASTYPLQIVQAARYLKAHETDPTLKPNKNWDDSVVALLNYPEVIELMNEDLDWTRELGEAAVYQQTALLDAIQEFRNRAHAAGNLKSDERQVVTKKEEVIVIEPADTKVIYVPYYEPEVVVVRHVYPVYHYYPRAYPVYYYPYPYGHSFGHGLFWGVTLAFAIDWHSHHVHVRHHHHYKHPYYGHYYHYPFYRRHTVRVSYRENVWRPRHHHKFRHQHAVARVKANRSIDATLARHATHRRRHDGPFSALAVEAAKRADGSKRTARGRDKAAFNAREVKRPRKLSRQNVGDLARRSEKFSGTRERAPRIERQHAQPSSARTRPRRSFGDVRSNRSSSNRSKWSNAPRYRTERSGMPQRSAPRRHDTLGPGSRGTQTLRSNAAHSRPSLRPGSNARFRAETRSGVGINSGGRGRSGFNGRSEFRPRSGAGGRAGSGGSSRRHIR